MIVIGIESDWTQRVVDGIAKSGKPVAGYSIEQNGDHKVIWAASRQAKEFLHWASEKQRETCSVDELWVSVKCGESDTTSGLASNPTVGNFIDKERCSMCELCIGWRQPGNRSAGPRPVVAFPFVPRYKGRENKTGTADS